MMPPTWVRRAPSRLFSEDALSGLIGIDTKKRIIHLCFLLSTGNMGSAMSLICRGRARRARRAKRLGNNKKAATEKFVELISRSEPQRHG